jgi:hypothetical protein
MNYLKKNFPIFLLSGSLIFAGISLSPSAQSATVTTSSLQKQIGSLQREIRSLKSCTNDAFFQISMALNQNSGFRFPPINC